MNELERLNEGDVIRDTRGVLFVLETAYDKHWRTYKFEHVETGYIYIVPPRRLSRFFGARRRV